MTAPHTPPAAPDLAAIEARAAAATPDAVTHSYEGLTRGENPRHRFSICNGTWEDEPTRPHRCIAMVYSDSEDSAPDADFYANARRDVFMLLAHVRRLTAALADSDARVASAVARAVAMVRDCAAAEGRSDEWHDVMEMLADDIADKAQPVGVYILSLKWSRGECLVWWRPESSGYTLRLDDAGVYTAEEADAICAPSPDEVVAVPAAVALSMCSRVVLDSARKRLLDAIAATPATGGA